MINIRQDALLLYLLDVREARYLPRYDDRRSWAMLDRTLALEYVERANQAKNAGVAEMRATLYSQDAYISAYLSRTEALKALVMGTCCQGSNAYAEAMADIIYAICSQPDWSLGSPDESVPDYTCSVIDLATCETGALLSLAGTVCQGVLDQISPRICLYISRCVKARILDPLINWEGVEWRIDDKTEARAVAALVTSALVGETDERRRWLCLRRTLGLLESFVKKLPQDGGFTMGLENHIDQSLALDDCFSFLSLATGGTVEMRDDAQFVRMAESILESHIDGEWFVNPNGISPKPMPDTDSLYRLGVDARSAKLCELAAYLRRIRGKDDELPRDFKTQTPPLYRQIMNAFGRSELASQSARVEKRTLVEKPNMKYLASRTGSFFAALTGCANKIGVTRAGDFTLFVDDEPQILTFVSDAPRTASVPTIAGSDQISESASDLDCGSGTGYQMLSMNIAPAYPKKAGVVSWQRTVMLLRQEQSVRLMDVFDLDASAVVTFRFILASPPRVEPGIVTSGLIEMQFDQELSVRVEQSITQSHDAFYRLELYTPRPLSSGNYSFVFRRLSNYAM